MKDEFYLPEPDLVATQSADNKQGRGESLPPEDAVRVIAAMNDEQRAVYANYETMLEGGVARELARANLPLATYTEMYWQIDLHNLLQFLRLRMDPHAQYEIRVYAEALARCAQAVAPIAYEAFEEHILGAVSFSRAECEALARMLDGGPGGLDGRALATFEAKLAKLRAATPSEAAEDPAPPLAETVSLDLPTLA